MLARPVGLFFEPGVADGGGVIGIVIVGEPAARDADSGAGEEAVARSLRRQATIATTIMTTADAIET